MKDDAKDARESMFAVMIRNGEKLKKDYRPFLPSEGALKRRLQRSRRKEQSALLKSLQDVNIQGEYVLLYLGHLELFHFHETTTKRIVLFSNLCSKYIIYEYMC